MTFNEGGSFEGGRVQSRRGGKGVAVGGGIGALVVAVVAAVWGVDLSSAVNGLSGGASEEQSTVARCTAEQANADRACRLSGTARSLDAYWSQALPAAGLTFAEPGVVEFADATSTGCGQASSATGPFYCPPDQAIYMDLTFFDELRTSYGATGGPLAEMYVTAHEYGHHVQQLTGVMDTAERGGTGATSDSVRVELQADCYAGIWTGHAAQTVNPSTGVTFLAPITPQELADALSAAAAVGDDHLQQQSGGGVDRDSWTHGSSEQRQRWFTTGYEQGTLAACDTFAASEL
ncbi:neutral zinc metallopeptidase [Cellulomonas sp. P22]|uniref:KPN_02809 family neutral zinc metallopeptidase n=1 Tax=Cellulomonas sp. P22 TaxID=3373189 RepID=UPI00378854BA